MNSIPNENKYSNADFEIDPNNGFLPNTEPLSKLSKEWEIVDELGAELPKLLLCDQVKQKIAKLKKLPVEKLNSRAERERAFMILSFLGHAYVWGEKKIPGSIPASLAVPWHKIGSLLGRPPVLSYASYALNNWRLVDNNLEISVENLGLRQNFLGGQDEDWFVTIHIEIEARASWAINQLLNLSAQAKAKDFAAASATLAVIAGALENIHTTLLRMPEKCDPYIYYNRVRPYIHGWSNHPALPDGLIYEGVEEYGNKPQKFRGETGAQSSIIPALDAALGINHQNDLLKQYLLEMRSYMPPAHKKFIEVLENLPNIREAILNARNEAGNALTNYNKCVGWVEKFRSLHLEYAVSYIHSQSEKTASNPNKVGTGGTPFVKYLEKHRDETLAHIIS
ncbi:MAG TPA: hypothetical protein PKD37_02885 [Oligoflexia bacterium]|nr:hypothetical protein [Oligoflexia bacterium]HMP26912.1 hypothetical protein [Oligoflexia bacterium]